MKECEDFGEVVKRSKIDFVEEFRKTLQDEITKTIEEADKEKIHHVYAKKVKYSEDDGYMRPETVWIEGE